MRPGTGGEGFHTGPDNEGARPCRVSEKQCPPPSDAGLPSSPRPLHPVRARIFAWLSGQMLRRMLLLLLPAMLLPIAVIAITMSAKYAQRSRSDIGRNQLYSMSQIAQSVEGYLDHIDQATLDLLYSHPVQEALSGRPLSRETRDQITLLVSNKTRQEGAAFLLVDSRGGAYSNTTNNYRADMLHESDIYRLFSQHYGTLRWTFGESALLPLDRYASPGMPALQAGRMMRHLDLSAPPGMLIVALPAARLESLFTDPLMQPGTRYLMINGQGTVMLDTAGTLSPGEPLDAPDILGRLRQGEGSFFGPSSLDTQLFVMHTLTREGFALISCLPEAVVNRTLSDMRAALLSQSVLAALLAVLLAAGFSGYYSAPVQAIARSMRRVRKGDFSARVHIRRRDEIGELADTFNIMTQDIAKLMQRAREDQEQLRKAHMSALMSQINPHFLYNTLDNIHMLAKQSADPRLPMLITELSNLLRVTLSGGREWIALRDELSHVRSYLGIMRLRGGDAFEYEVTSDEEVLGTLVQKLILQPLVENALIHGLRYRDGDGFVRVSARAAETGVVLTVADNGVGLSDEDIARIAGQPLPGGEDGDAASAADNLVSGRDEEIISIAGPPPRSGESGDAASAADNLVSGRDEDITSIAGQPPRRARDGKTASSPSSGGLGLRNVRERLLLTYGPEGHSITFARSELGGLRVTVTLMSSNIKQTMYTY